MKKVHCSAHNDLSEHTHSFPLIVTAFLTVLLFSCAKNEDPVPTPEPTPEPTEDTVPWIFDKCLDPSVAPGSDFYSYAAAGYVTEYGGGVMDEQEYKGEVFCEQALQSPSKSQLQTLSSLNSLSADEMMGKEQLMFADYFNRADTLSTKELLELLVERSCCSEASFIRHVANYAERKGRIIVMLKDGCSDIVESYSSTFAAYSGYSVEYVTKMIQDAKKVSAIIAQYSEGTSTTKIGARYSPYAGEGSTFGPMRANATKGSGLTESQKILCDGFGLAELEYEHIYNWNGLGDRVLEFIDFILNNDSADTRECIASYYKLCKLYSSYDALCTIAKNGNCNDWFLSKRFVKMLISNQFIEERVTQDDINSCRELGEAFRSAFESRIDSLEWMSPSTKEYAKDKLENMYFWYGHPSASLSSFEIAVSESDLQGAPSECVAELEKSFYDEVVKPYIKSDDYGDDMLYVFSLDDVPAYVANAFYSPQSNSMCLPASNLISPVTRNDVSAAYNFAVIGGTTIGHEMCHGFDAKGSHYDAIGAQTNWWTVSDALKFTEKQNQLADIFSQYEIGGTYIDGDNTIAENMADFGGIVVGLDALVRLRREQGFDEEGIREQMRRYFISWAIGWSGTDVKTVYPDNVHSPGYFRVNGQVNLMDEWYEIFDVKWGDKYYLEPQQRVKIW